jgi:hypothetical protein
MPPPQLGPVKYAVSIDGIAVPVASPGGGYAKAEVSTKFPVAGGPPQRQISSFAYTNLRFELGLDVGTPILNWINAALKGEPVSKSGTLIELDTKNRATSYLDFTDGVIEDFVFPGLDGASKSSNTFSLEVSISESRIRQGDLAPVHLPGKPKAFLASNFRLTVDGLPTARVGAIEPLSFRRTDGGVVPTDLVATLSDVEVEPWRAWVDDFIVNEHNGQDKERQGSIEVLSPNMVDVLVTLTVKQIGILELAPTGNVSPRTHRVSMYFEYAQLNYP